MLEYTWNINLGTIEVQIANKWGFKTMNYQKASHRIKVSWLKWRGAYQYTLLETILSNSLFADNQIRSSNDSRRGTQTSTNDKHWPQNFAFFYFLCSSFPWEPKESKYEMESHSSTSSHPVRGHQIHEANPWYHQSSPQLQDRNWMTYCLLIQIPILKEATIVVVKEGAEQLVYLLHIKQIPKVEPLRHSNQLKCIHRSRLFFLLLCHEMFLLHI